MSELKQIVFTACATLAGGCVLYVFSELLNKVLLQPYLEYRKVLGEITYNLIFHANELVSGRFQDDPAKHQRIAEEIRALASKLQAATSNLPCYTLLHFIRLVPNPRRIHSAAGLLIRISNLVFQEKKFPTIFDDIAEVGNVLGISTGRDPNKPFKRHD